MLDTDLIASGPRGARRSFSSSTMKHTFLVMMFAAAPLLAQGSEKARVELANAIAVEEQERDLAKAEKAYRAAIDDTKLSVAARDLAKERLGLLLKQLGRDAEAKQFLPPDKGTAAKVDGATNPQQDVEREKALRAKARELVQERLTNPTGGSQPLEQLMWVGEPAIPEIAAALTGKAAKFNTAEGSAIADLAGLLWYFGTPSAESHIETLLRGGDTELRRCIVAPAWQMRDPRMRRFAERWLQQEKDEDVAMQLMTSPRGPLSELDADVLMDVVARRSPRMQRWVLLSMPNRDASRSAIAKAHALARTFLAGADPELGQAAQQFLGSQASQISPEGVELLLQQLPHIRNSAISVATTQLPNEWLLPKSAPDRPAPVRPEAAARLWPQLVACAMTLPPDSRCRSWLDNHLSSCARALDAAILPDVLALIERGIGDAAWLRGKVNTANAAAVLGTYDKVEQWEVRAGLLKALGRADLPADLFGPLRDRAASRVAEREEDGGAFVRPIAKTGHADAGAWLLAFLKDATARNVAPGVAVDGLIELGRRSTDEKVRAAMREAIGMVKDGHVLTSLLLALLSMHDEGALPLVVEHLSLLVSQVHPYATKRTEEQITPLQYLLYPDPDPPHGFSEDELVAWMPRLVTSPGIITKSGQLPGTPALDPTKLTNRVLVAGFEAGIDVTYSIDRGAYVRADWRNELLRRTETEDAGGPLHRWFDESLRKRGAALGLLEPAKAEQLEQVRPILDALLAGDDEDAAFQVMHSLARKALPLDLDALMQSKHEAVRTTAFWLALDRGQLSNEKAIAALANNRDNNRIAQYLGERVAVEAVPALIGLLKDPIDVVRVAAAESLNKIRFHHEQQTYWDRIVKGLDASPASAAEKLLLQAKPGAPKPQRLLAITSLGTLGAPEALPFLIDWTQDADAEIAKKATDAITQIHLNPRK